MINFELKKRHARNTQNVALAVRSPPAPAQQVKPAMESPKGGTIPPHSSPLSSLFSLLSSLLPTVFIYLSLFRREEDIDEGVLARWNLSHCRRLSWHHS